MTSFSCMGLHGLHCFGVTEASWVLSGAQGGNCACVPNRILGLLWRWLDACLTSVRWTTDRFLSECFYIIKHVQCVWFVLAKDSDALNNLDSVEAVTFMLGLMWESLKLLIGFHVKGGFAPKCFCLFNACGLSFRRQHFHRVGLFVEFCLFIANVHKLSTVSL